MSPDGRWTAVFSDPQEWRMGADSWKLQILHDGADVTAQHRAVTRLRNGFRCDLEPHCWNHESRSLTLSTWDEGGVYIYDVATKSIVKVASTPSWPFSTHWSPTLDRLLLTDRTRGVLVDRHGVERGCARWTTLEYELPYTYWLRDGDVFFLLARASPTDKTMITFYSGDDGRLLEAHAFDPAAVVPYDAAQYAEVPRDRFSLIASRSTRHAGSLLDAWSSVQFDSATGTLYLAVDRPISEVYTREGELRCDIEERWAAVDIS